jgi:hypothetical protein
VKIDWIILPCFHGELGYRRGALIGTTFTEERRQCELVYLDPRSEKYKPANQFHFSMRKGREKISAAFQE